MGERGRAEGEAGFEAVERKMRAAHLPELAIAAFREAWTRVARGETGLLSRHEIEPVPALPDAATLAPVESDRRAQELLRHSVIVKLNGGLGTSMGLDRAKSLLPVRPGVSFLDVIARQTLALRSAHGVPLPLLLMNSFRTRDDSLAALARHPRLPVGLPLDFVQHRVPRVREDDLSPVEWPADPSLEWCPPGHGDLYLSLATSGLLAELLDAGYRHAFVSNADNLGATVDLSILAFVAENDLPFLMEVADRTLADRKGGHLARRRDGTLVLRESAQCPPDETDEFQDIERHRYFNTNNLWVDLRALDALLARRGGALGLPLIRNAKRVDPRDPASPRCLQLETAMGAAIELFDGAGAIRVPRTRFAPVKTTNDLLVLWSDLYRLHDDGRLEPIDSEALRALRVDLDPAFFGAIDDFVVRFARGAPSLRNCRGLAVRGDVHFGEGVVLEGEVRIESEGRREIPDGARLSD